MREVGAVDEGWPVGPDELEARALQALGREAFDWIAGGAGDEWTLRENRDAFRRWGLVPRVLSGNVARVSSVTVLGASSPAPFLLAPIGALTLAHPEAEVAVGRAAAAEGVPYLVSQASSRPMEEVAAAMGRGTRWYQLYWVNDRPLVESLVDRALASGHSAIVLTVDTPSLGLRERDLRNAYSPFVLGHGIGQYTSDPVFRAALELPPEEDPAAAGTLMAQRFENHALAWKDLEWLRGRTELPLVLKGVLAPDDARRALQAGFEAIVVSNHGGRQLDGAVAALDALPRIRDAVGTEATVLMDGGIRRGVDVIKALALGANSVLLGRPYVYGLAIAGETGVRRVIQGLVAEIDKALGLLGASSIGEINRGWVARI